MKDELLFYWRQRLHISLISVYSEINKLNGTVNSYFLKISLCFPAFRVYGFFVDLNGFLGPGETPIDLKAEDRWAAIDELIDHLVASHKFKAEHREAIDSSLPIGFATTSNFSNLLVSWPHDCVFKNRKASAQPFARS